MINLKLTPSKIFSTLATFLLFVLSTQFVVAANPIFSDVTSSSQLTKSMGVGSTVTWIDFDNDGWDDLYDAGSGNLYRNQHDGTFVPVDNFNISGAQGVAVGDYNNDGWDDILATPILTLDSEGGFFIGAGLFHNNGDGSFADITQQVGIQGLPNMPVFSKTANFGDIDNDGDLDLYVGGWGVQASLTNTLFRNNLVETGIASFTLVPSIIENFTGSMFASVMSDYNDDGLVDLVLVRDGNAAFQWPSFFRNDGMGNFVVDVNAPILPIIGMGVAVGDYNHDGLQDYYATSGAGDNFFAKNLGDGFFDRATEETGTSGNENNLSGTGNHMWGTAFLDADNDGDLDLYAVASGQNDPDGARFYNNVGATFVEMSDAAQTGYSAEALAIADYDHDGRMDMVINGGISGLTLLHNETPYDGNHWLEVRLAGVESNKRGIGAKITVNSSDGSQLQEIHSGSSKGNNHSFAAHFGFSAGSTLNWMTVKWPSGAIDMITAPPQDRMITVVEGQGILGAPVITNVNSTTTDIFGLSGQIGGLVFLNGNNFCEEQCFSTANTETVVTIGGITTSPLYVQGDFLYFAIPEGATTGILQVKTPLGTAMADSVFRIIP